MLKLALVSGVNKYANYPKSTLAGCIPDAQALQGIFGGLGCEVVYLADRGATDSAILACLNNFLGQARKAPSFYVGWWHSSHGSHYDRPEEVDGLGEGLCCYNLAEQGRAWSGGFIKDQTLRALLNQFPKTGVVEVGLDTCYSGGMDRDLNPAQQPRFLHSPGNPDKLLRLSTEIAGLNANVVMWQACSEAQTSADAYIKSGYHGAFTWAFGEALKAQPKGSRLEILLAARKILKDRDFDQLPRLKAWNTQVQQAVGP